MRNTIALLLFAALIPLQASAGFKSVSAGVAYPTPQGTRYSTLQRKFGYEAHTLTHTDIMKWLDKFDMKFSGFYQPYALYGKQDVNLDMLGVLVGLETRGLEHNFILHPYFGMQAGVIYDWLSFANAETLQNSQFHLIARASTGFDVVIWKQISAVLDLPLTMIYRTTGPLMVWNANALVRWRFE